jgi:hypothetical protein
VKVEEKKIGEKLKKIWKEIYGEDRINGVFNGGNVGMMFIAASIEKMADSVSELSEAIKDIKTVINQDKNKQAADMVVSALKNLKETAKGARQAEVVEVTCVKCKAVFLASPESIYEDYICSFCLRKKRGEVKKSTEKLIKNGFRIKTVIEIIKRDGCWETFDDCPICPYEKYCDKKDPDFLDLKVERLNFIKKYLRRVEKWVKASVVLGAGR